MTNSTPILSKPVEEKDLMLFGKTKEELAKMVNSGEIKIEWVLNEWGRRYAEDIKEMML